MLQVGPFGAYYKICGDLRPIRRQTHVFLGRASDFIQEQSAAGHEVKEPLWPVALQNASVIHFN
jgi:hypothetical protein